MYSKKEALFIKKEFWVAFASVYPRKWLLYDTKIKDVTFKFYVDNKKAQVLFDIEPKEEELRKVYFEKIESLKKVLSKFSPIENIRFSENYNVYFENDSFTINNIFLEFKLDGNWHPFSNLSDGTKRLFYIISGKKQNGASENESKCTYKPVYEFKFFAYS